MKLNLLDVSGFIERNGIKQVTGTRVYTGGGKTSLDPNGLFSEEIFGRLGSRERKKTFGYVDLKTKIIHPEVWPVLTSLNTELTKYILNKEKYIITDEGTLEQNEIDGQSGVYNLIKNFDKLNIQKLADKKSKEFEFIEQNKKYLFIDKYLILPAGIRDIFTSSMSGKTTVQYSEITQLYERLLKQSNSIVEDIETLGDDFASTIIEKLQHTLNSINSWIKDRMKGKHGLIKGGLLKKVTDYSARLIMVPDPTLDMGWCGIPWQVILKLYEPYTINQILYKDKDVGVPLIKQHLNTEEDIDVNELKRFIAKTNDDPSVITGVLKDYLLSVAKTVIKDKIVIYKRDPCENRDSWISSYVKIIEDGFVFHTNTYDLDKNTGDFDGDTVAVFALLTEESQKQAKEQMNVIHTKSAWYSGKNAHSSIFKLALDASTAIYTATKK